MSRILLAVLSMLVVLPSLSRPREEPSLLTEKMRLQAEERLVKARGEGTVLFDKTFQVTFDPNRDKKAWIPLTTVGTRVECRLDSNLFVRVEDASMADQKTKVTVVARFKERCPVGATLDKERPLYERLYDRVRVDGSNYFLTRHAQHDSTTVWGREKEADPKRAKLVTWGPNWTIHDRSVEFVVVVTRK